MSDALYVTPNGLYEIRVEDDAELNQAIYVVYSARYGVKEHKTAVLLDALNTAKFLDKKIVAFYDTAGQEDGEFDGILDTLLQHPPDEDIH